MLLQSPITAGSHIIIVTRFSKEEQRRQSAEDQYQYCLAFLDTNKVKWDSIRQISDEESGKVVTETGFEISLETLRLAASTSLSWKIPAVCTAVSISA